MTHEQLMKRAIELAEENVRRGEVPLAQSLHVMARFWPKA